MQRMGLKERVKQLLRQLSIVALALAFPYKRTLAANNVITDVDVPPDFG